MRAGGTRAGSIKPQRSACAFAGLEAAQSGNCAAAAAGYEYSLPGVHARSSSIFGPEAGKGSFGFTRLNHADRVVLELACAASPLGSPTGEGARALLAVHGSLLRYGGALDEAHDELQRHPAPGLASGVGAAVAAAVGGSSGNSEW
mmetsp:Transcript_23079/g.58595  ORF Transcript_23079/g.58595 Transcript_23079/m.58595 type:complete len:146 (+) Transcript_23079:222-659(+)